MSNDIKFVVNDNYEIRGIVTHFESYMFATEDRHILKHVDPDVSLQFFLINGNERYPNEARSVCEDELFAGEGICLIGPDLNTRKRLLHVFNNMAIARDLDVPSPAKLSCGLIDIKCDLRFQSAMSGAGVVFDNFAAFARARNLLGICAAHLCQDAKPPHVHVLYQRESGNPNAFQDFFRQMLA